MHYFLAFFILILTTPNLWAQGVLVAWQLGQVPTIVELVATETLSPLQISGEYLPNLPSSDYELILYQVADRQQRLTLMRELNNNPKVIFVELDVEVTSPSNLQAPNHFSQLNLVDASERPIQYPCANFPIAIIDTGINMQHPSFEYSVIFDFQKNYLGRQATSSAEDDDGHGTHIAGLIAAIPTSVANTSGQSAGVVAGICSTATLHAMKALPNNNAGRLSDIYTAFTDALNKGAERFPIINASMVTRSGRSLQGVMAELSQAGQFVIAAAGNDSALIDTQPRYPAAYSNSLETIISVANSNTSNQLSTTSNYGYQLVDLAAPGENLLSTWINNANSEPIFKYSSGTSMSTPLVAATLAALMQKYHSYRLPPAAFRAALINSLTLQSNLEGKLRYPGILSTGTALEADFNDLFKPTWFNFEWVEGADALYIKGYQLEKVNEVTFKTTQGNLSDLVDFSYDTKKQALLINLPEEWQTGYLQIAAVDHDLANLDFTLMANNALPAGIVNCELEVCQITFEDYQLEVIRLDGNKNSRWWLSSRLKGEVELLVITGADLSANWTFQIAGEPRIKLVSMQAEKPELGMQTLTRADGYQANASGDSASWYLDQPQNWSAIDPPLQQLVLSPKVEAHVYKSSSGHCFIATSVYGDANAPEVIALREFRDQVLMQSYLGRQLINFYYAYSPSLVEWMADKPKLQTMIRNWLNWLVQYV